MSETTGGGGSGGGPSGPSGGDHSSDVSLSSTSESTHTTTQSGGVDVTTTVVQPTTTTPVTSETSISDQTTETSKPEPIKGIPEARWEDKSHPTPKEDFAKVANERNAETTVHKKPELEGVQDSAQQAKPRDEFWKDPNRQVPLLDPKKGMVSMKDLAALEKERSTLTPKLVIRGPGQPVKMEVDKEIAKKLEDDIDYQKGRMKDAHDKFKKDFDDRSRSR